MLVNNLHLSYCTNIHPGNNWDEDFAALKQYFPLIKKQVSPDAPMAIGLRVSNESSKALVDENEMDDFKQWLTLAGGYVTTINGFPYGNFHHIHVKENVHTPDWSTDLRKNYTMRLIKILNILMPEGAEGGVSTSPLSYKHWFANQDAYNKAKSRATDNIIDVISALIELSSAGSKTLHLDIEPEPDGMIETGKEFLDWFEDYLQPRALPALMRNFNVTYNIAGDLLKKHLRLCFDVCHFAIGYEDYQDFFPRLLDKRIRVGRIQVSSALKAKLPALVNDRKKVIKAITAFDESTYLHQVIAKLTNGKLLRYRDLPYAISDYANPEVTEWRAHFHLPVSEAYNGYFTSTRDDIVEVLNLNRDNNLTCHLEIETYTWGVLPYRLKLPIEQSICKELRWVIDQLNSSLLYHEKNRSN